jgi:hypothetical protein
MFYEEKVIDGCLCFRLDPRSGWEIKLNREDTIKYLEQKTSEKHLQDFVDMMLHRTPEIINFFQLELAF